MAATSFFELLLMSSWFFLPLGVPPGPEDPLLAKMAPEKCLYYMSSAGIVAPDPTSENQTERMLLDPEVKEFVEQLFPRIKASMNKLIVEQGAPPQAAIVVDVFPTFMETLLTEPAAFFLSDVKLNDAGGPPEIDGALIVNTSRRKKEVNDGLKKLEPLLAEVTQQVEIAGKKFTRMDIREMDPGAPVVTFGTVGDHFLLCLGTDTMAETLKRKGTPAPKWLTDARKLVAVPRTSTVAYADLKAIMDITKRALRGNADAIDQVLNESGLAKIDSYINVTGLDKRGWIGRTLLRVNGKPTGWLALLGERSLTAEDISSMPADATLALAGRVDSTKVLDILRSLMTMAGGINELEQTLAGIRQFTGVDVEKELLPELGDVWQIYTSPREGDVVTGWTATVSIKDQAKLAGISDKIVAQMNQMFAGEFRAPRFKTSEFAGEKINTMVVPDDDFLVELSWCVAKDQLIIGLFPQAVKSHLRGSDKPLNSTPEVGQLFASGRAPTFVGYNDTATIVERIYPFAQIGLRMFLVEMQEEGVEIDLSMLPSCRAITRHLRPGTQSVRWTKAGLYSESRQTLPTGNVGAVLPLAMVGAAPATMQARVVARQNQGMNQLRQIGLAMLNFESANRAFPASYNTDDSGKPLLSWRVHVLPYLEEAALYERFRLDEPWNSPHNRKLIAAMPPVFKSPGSMADPGKTTYLAFDSEGSVISAPAKDGTNRGRRIRDVRDGTSKTLLVVDVNDESAMIWTKPGDFEPDEDDPFKGLLNDRGFFQAVFCDGHVSQLNPGMGKRTLQLLIDASDGQPVNPF